MNTCRALHLAAPAAALALVLSAQPAASQERPYTEETVWVVTYVKTAPGQYNAYLRNLQGLWKRVNDEAMRKGYLVSYKILTAPAGSPDDWDLLLLEEYPNMAALDNFFERWDPILEATVGDLDAQSQATVKRAELRTIIGSRLTREIKLK